MKKTYSVSIILNIIIFLLVVFSIVSTVIGFQFMSSINVLSSTNFQAFRYFTVDSNILAGIVSLIYVIYMIRQKKRCNGGRIVIPRWFSMLKLASTTGVTLTMMVTVFFLAPASDRGYFALFMNSNLFMHFVIPALCIVSFIFFEPTEKLRLSHTLTGIIPMFIYSIYYSLNILLHMENGQPNFKYDLYGFLGGKLSNIWFVMPAIYAITWIFSFLLWLGNKKRASGN